MLSVLFFFAILQLIEFLQYEQSHHILMLRLYQVIQEAVYYVSWCMCASVHLKVLKACILILPKQKIGSNK